MDHVQGLDQSCNHSKALVEDPPTAYDGSTAEEQETNSMEKAAAAVKGDSSKSGGMTTTVFLAVLALSCTYVGEIDSSTANGLHGY